MPDRNTSIATPRDAETMRGMPVAPRHVRARGLVKSGGYKFAVALQFESIQDATDAHKSLSDEWKRQSDHAPHILVWVGDVLAYEVLKDMLMEFGVQSQMLATGEFDCSIAVRG